MGKYDDRPYEVGKGKPPKEYCWKPGQSGSPKGPKPKANAERATMNELLAEILNESVDVTKIDKKSGKEKTVKMPLKKYILSGIARDAVSGTPAERLRAFNALHKVGAFDLGEADKQVTPQQHEQHITEVLQMLANDCEREGLIERESSDPFDPLYNSYKAVGD